MTVLRSAQSLDAGAVGAILSEFVDDTPWLPRLHTRAEDVAHAAQMIDRGWVTVAVGDAGICGFSARNGPELNALYVAGGARGRGIGAALLAQSKTGTATLDLWTFQENLGAQRFYKRHGFAEVARTDGDNEEGLPDIRLQWHRKDT